MGPHGYKVSIHLEPGIDVNYLASDERGHGMHQEPDHVGDFVRLAETVCGNHLQQLSALASGEGTMMARISGGSCLPQIDAMGVPALPTIARSP